MEFLKKFTKKDLTSSLITGFYTGVIIWQILNFLEAPSFGLPTNHPHALFVIIVPVLWVLGVNFGYFLGQWMAFFNQFGKYAAIGFTNAAVDFGILNLLIAFSGVASGILFSVFKTVSFVVAVSHSYYWNKRWAFSVEGETMPAGENHQKQQFFKFMVVNVIAALINVAIASFVVNGMDPLFGIKENTWANVGAIVGSAVALIFSFVGLRLIVFKGSSQKLEQ